jgi:hypothetical protein
MKVKQNTNEFLCIYLIWPLVIFVLWVVSKIGSLPLESATASIVQNYCTDFVDVFFYYAHWRHDIAGCINTGENGTW